MPTRGATGPGTTEAPASGSRSFAEVDSDESALDLKPCILMDGVPHISNHPFYPVLLELIIKAVARQTMSNVAACIVQLDSRASSSLVCLQSQYKVDMASEGIHYSNRRDATSITALE